MLAIPLLLSVLLLIFTALARWRSKDEDEKAPAEDFPTRLREFVPSEEIAPEVDAFVFNELRSRVSIGGHQCAACFATASTRCSRCKAVRYCSSKCQISHWRQSHKYECHPQVLSESETDDFSGKAEIAEQSQRNGLDFSEDLPKPNNESTINQMPFNISDSHDILPRLSTVTVEKSDNIVRPDAPVNLEGPVSEMKSRNVVQKEGKSGTLGVDTSFSSPGLGHSERKLNKERSMRSGGTKPKDSNSNLSPGFEKYNPSKGASSGDFHYFKSQKVPDVKHSDSMKYGEYKDLANKQSDYNLSLARNVGSSSYLAHSGIKSSFQKVMEQLKTSNKKKPPLTNNFIETLENRDGKDAFQRDAFMRLYSSNEIEMKPFGLVNCGNSCYANAVLQCLTYTRPLTLYLLQGLHTKECRKDESCFICEFEYLILKGSEGNTPLSPVRILSNITHLGHGRQEDAHEFLRYAVDTMQSICVRQAQSAGWVAEETTLIGMTFGGYLHSKIKCMKCRSKSEKYERMMDLTVEIDGDIRTLDQALKRFTTSELLKGENKFYCSRCKSYVEAKKKLTVFQAPNILTIVLKRFKAGNLTKLSKPVRFPETLNMTPYMSGLNDGLPHYSLYAVVVHLNVTNASVSGHYVCYVKNYSEKWFKIDDTVVIRADLERILSEEAYMLLYARDSPTLPTSPGSAFEYKGRETNFEAVPSRGSGKSAIPKPRNRSSDVNADPLVMKHQPTRKGNVKNPSYLEEWVTQSVESIPIIDSSTEASSLFSLSEEACSTPSTKDTASHEDFSDYLFGKGTSTGH